MPGGELYRAALCTSVGNRVIGFYPTAEEASEALEEWVLSNAPAIWTPPDLIGDLPPPRKEKQKAKPRPAAKPRRERKFLGKAELLVADIVYAHPDGIRELNLGVLVKEKSAAGAKNFRRTLARLLQKKKLYRLPGGMIAPQQGA